MYEEFRAQLSRDAEQGWYETGLSWKGNHPPLPSSYNGSLRCFNTQVRKLKKIGKLEEYDAIIRDQLKKGVVKRASEKVLGKEFYMPHRALIREKAKSTNTQVVYDCSAHEGGGKPSFNDCLDVGPPLQNKLWDVLVCCRFDPVAGDLKKALLQFRIREIDRDALRFHWLRSLDSDEVKVSRFTCALFGLGPSPFLLEGVI